MNIMINIFRDPLWQGVGGVATIIIGFIGFYYAGKNKTWLLGAGITVVLIVGLAAGVQLSTQAASKYNPCRIFLESNGQVVIDADKYVEQVSGRKHTTDINSNIRDASGMSWQKNPAFANAMKALPDTQSTNTMADTNGPALVYLIDFQTKGNYYVYIKGFGASSDSDSIHFGLDGIPATTEIKNGFSLPINPAAPQWVNSVPGENPIEITVLNPGIHSFFIWMRENGVTIQRIWLDTGINKIGNGDVGSGPKTSECK